MLVVRFHDFCQSDIFIMIPGIGILFRNIQPDGILRAVMDAGHTQLAVFHRTAPARAMLMIFPFLRQASI